MGVLIGVVGALVVVAVVVVVVMKLRTPPKDSSLGGPRSKGGRHTPIPTNAEDGQIKRKGKHADKIDRK